MATLKLTNKQLRLIQRALDFYSRVGILQFEEILSHPTIENLIFNNCTELKKLEVGDETLRGEIVEIGEGFIKTKGSWGKGEEIKTWTDVDKISLSPDWSKYHQTKDIVKSYFETIKQIITNDNLFKGGHLGIYNEKQTDKSCREAFDIVQVIRHEFWKEDSNRSNVTVDSSISLCTNEPEVQVQLDTLKEIRKQKINKIQK